MRRQGACRSTLLHRQRQRHCTRQSTRRQAQCDKQQRHDDSTGELCIHRVQGEELREKHDAARALLKATTGLEWKFANNECMLVGDVRDKKGQTRLYGALVYVRVDALELQLLQLAVCPSARRRGVGRALVQRAVAEAGDDARIVLEVADTNEAAKALYTGEGFVVNGRRRAYYPDGADALLMTKEPL